MKKRPERDLARQLYLAGATYPELAARFGASPSTVSLWCRDLAQARLAASKAETAVRRAQADAERNARIAHREANRVRVPAQRPYEGWFLYTYESRDGVSRVQIVNPKTKKHVTLSLARYRMAVKLRRRIRDNEVVGHRDEDKSNDDIANLEILTRSDKGKKTALHRYPRSEKSCVICETTFMPVRPKTETCSRECKYKLVGLVLSQRARG